MAATPTIKYSVQCDECGDIVLSPVIHEGFIRLMDALYPQLISNSEDRKGGGYSAFLRSTGEFIGCFAGLDLASVRKNPWFVDDEQWFLRSLLAACTISGYAHRHRSRCVPQNYGTLRLWQKLGLGAKLTARGDYVSAGWTEESSSVLSQAILAAKEDYADIRGYASLVMGRLELDKRKALLPTMPETGKGVRVVSCHLALG